MVTETVRELVKHKRAIAKQIAALQSQSKKLTKAIQMLSKLPGGLGVRVRKRTMSPAARRKISIARKKWWAEKKAAAAKAGKD